MNDMYNYSNNINNNGNPTLPKKNNTGIIVAICLILVAAVTFLVFEVVKEMKKEIPDKEKEPIIELKSYESIKNYTFTMDLDYLKGNYVYITAEGVANISKNIEEINFIHNSDSYYIYTNYNTGIVSIYNSNNVLIKEKTTDAKYTLNLEDIITKIRDNSVDVDNLSDGHYYVRTGMIRGNSVYADVYTKNGYVTKVEYDLTNHLSFDGYSKYKVSFKLYNYNDKDLM